MTQYQFSTAALLQWCSAMSCLFFPNLKLFAGSAASQIWSMLFCLCVSLWVSRYTSCLGWPWPWLQWELLPFTDSSSWTHPTAWVVSSEVCGHRDTHRRVRLCLQQPWNPPVVAADGCGWLLCSTRSSGKGGKLYSKGGNRNIPVLWGKGGEKAKHLRNSTKAAGIGEGRRFWDDKYMVIERIFVFKKRVNFSGEKKKKRENCGRPETVFASGRLCLPFIFLLSKYLENLSVFLPFSVFFFLFCLTPN